MNAEKTNVELFNKQTRKQVSAVLIEPLSKEAVMDVKTHWSPIFDKVNNSINTTTLQTVQNSIQDAHWRWDEKAAAIEGQLIYRGFSIECDGKTQGLMILELGKRCMIPSQKDKGLVYVHFIATAPWNRNEIYTNPLYGGVGKVLLAVAFNVSLDSGFEGRVGLHSLKQSESWYKSKMTDMGIDELYQGNLKYFESTPEQAINFLGI